MLYNLIGPPVIHIGGKCSFQRLITFGSPSFRLTDSLLALFERRYRMRVKGDDVGYVVWYVCQSTALSPIALTSD